MRRTALVTGAAGGIGRAICHRLAADEWAIMAIDLSPQLAVLAAELEEAGAEVHPIEANLVTDGAIDEIERQLEGEPALELIVNNAGVTRDARLINLSEEEVTTVLDVNLGAPLRLVQRLAPRMSTGAIVNIASRAYLGNFGQYNYSMSKGGLVGMTRGFALALAPRIRVNAIAPGLIDTEMTRSMPEEVLAKMVAAIPLGRMGEAAEVAEVVAFLARPGYITGEVVVVGGGRSLSR